MTRNIIVDDINVTLVSEEQIPIQEIRAYINEAHKDCGKGEKITELTITLDKNDPENVSLDYGILPPKFSRIRRITGYLVGNLDRWNEAKRHEEHDRLKHFHVA